MGIHAGPIVDEIEGVPQHCKTTLFNSRCPYLKLGCLGCTRKSSMIPVQSLSRLLGLEQQREQPTR